MTKDRSTDDEGSTTAIPRIRKLREVEHAQIDSAEVPLDGDARPSHGSEGDPERPSVHDSDALTGRHRPRRRRRARRPSKVRSEAESVVARALLEEEGVRARGFSAILALASAGALVVLPFLGGDELARHLSIAAVATIFGSSLVVHRRTRDPGRYSMALHRAYGFLIGTVVAFPEYYVGMFSPTPAILMLGMFFVGQSKDRVGSLAIPIYVIVRWTILAALVVAGVVRDRGLIDANDADPITRIVGVVAVPAILGLALRMARVNRASLDAAMKQAQDAIVLAHERESQMDEAQQNLDRALRAVVGRDGRYTGRTAGRYTLEEIIGVGAMGEVYAASSSASDEPVAVKLMQADAAEREDLVERFLREGEISRRLRSPNIVRVLEVGRVDDGAPYLAMERLRGDDLAAILRRRGHLELDDAVALAVDVARGLDAAHAAQIVHRDLKPQNLFLADRDDGRPAWKILDFGVSKILGATTSLTRADVVGTPGYMSPEQVQGREIDGRSDLFSMAVVLYRAITGQQAFGGRGVPEKLFEIVYRMPDAPSSVKHELPEELDHVFAIALAKDPAHRFESASALADAFARAVRRELPRAIVERGIEAARETPWGGVVGAPPP